MEKNGDPGHSGRSPEEPGERPESASGGSAEDVLSRLEQRLDAASEAAERLFTDAAAHVAGKPPPAGWQRRRPQQPAGQGEPPLFGSDTDILLGLLAAVRDRIPPELQQRLADAVREVLLAIRALIDWYLERSDRREDGGREVQDIPIL